MPRASCGSYLAVDFSAVEKPGGKRRGLVRATESADDEHASVGEPYRRMQCARNVEGESRWGR